MARPIKVIQLDNPNDLQAYVEETLQHNAFYLYDDREPDEAVLGGSYRFWMVSEILPGVDYQYQEHLTIYQNFLSAIICKHEVSCVHQAKQKGVPYVHFTEDEIKGMQGFVRGELTRVFTRDKAYVSHLENPVTADTGAINHGIKFEVVLMLSEGENHYYSASLLSTTKVVKLQDSTIVDEDVVETYTVRVE